MENRLLVVSLILFWLVAGCGGRSPQGAITNKPGTTPKVKITAEEPKRVAFLTHQARDPLKPPDIVLRREVVTPPKKAAPEKKPIPLWEARPLPKAPQLPVELKALKEVEIRPVLLGIIRGQPTVAVIKVAEQSFIVKRGDVILGEYVVQDFGLRQVILQSGKEKITLTIQEEKKKETGGGKES